MNLRNKTEGIGSRRSTYKIRTLSKLAPVLPVFNSKHAGGQYGSD